MTTISIEELFLVTLVVVDDWYTQKGQYLLKRSAGVKPTFSDSEMLTLMLAIDFFGFSSERRYHAFVQANYLDLFPQLLDQSQYNRRARSLRFLLNALRQDWANELGVQWEKHFLLDTTPVPVVGYRRDKSHSHFRGSADYGYCAARRMKYYGYKLVMLTTLNGTPYSFELVPADTDERVAADEILDTLPVGSNVWSDKGFIDADWQADWQAQAVYVWTAKRENQHQQNPPVFDQLLNHVRERIEGAFDILKEGGRSVEKTLAITVEGVCSRVIAKISSVTLRLFLRKFFGIDVLTYTVNP
jgi:Transposase DDE domain